MSDSAKSRVGRLLRVLVTGGVALAGLVGPAVADDKAPADKGTAEKAKEKEQGKTAEKDKGKAPEKDKDKDQKDAKAGKEAGGVKGW
jgi:hypothetical protein